MPMLSKDGVNKLTIVKYTLIYGVSGNKHRAPEEERGVGYTEIRGSRGREWNGSVRLAGRI